MLKLEQGPQSPKLITTRVKHDLKALLAILYPCIICTVISVVQGSMRGSEGLINYQYDWERSYLYFLWEDFILGIGLLG